MRKFKPNLGIYSDILSIQININLEWMPEDLVDGKSTLVQVMALVPEGTKPLSEPMLTKISDAMLRLYATMDKWLLCMGPTFTTHIIRYVGLILLLQTWI